MFIGIQPPCTRVVELTYQSTPSTEPETPVIPPYVPPGTSATLSAYSGTYLAAYSGTTLAAYLGS